jgi:hypothetical protein
MQLYWLFVAHVITYRRFRESFQYQYVMSSILRAKKIFAPKQETGNKATSKTKTILRTVNVIHCCYRTLYIANKQNDQH